MMKANSTANSEAVHAARLISVQNRRTRFLATGAMSGGALRKLMLTASVVAFASLHANPASAGDFVAGGGTTTPSGNAIAIGTTAHAVQSGNSIAIGAASTTDGSNAVAIGQLTHATGDVATAIGSNSRATGLGATAIGGASQANGAAATATGRSSFANGASATATGQASTADGTTASAFGQGSQAVSDAATAIGQASTASAVGATAVGQGSAASGTTASAFGQGSQAVSDAATAIGQASTASAVGATAVGQGSAASGINATAVGIGASAAFNNSAAFGSGATASAPNQIAVGTTLNTYKLSGVASAASLSAQSGPIKVVTTDAAGNLATAAFSGVSNSQDIATLQSNVSTLQTQIRQAFEGTAMAIALGGSALPADKKFAFSANWGTFRGENAVGLSGQMRLSQYVVMNGGVASGFAQGGVGGRAGLTVAW
jgi:hypothetical protein